MNILYCCNKKYFDGLYLSILSMLKTTKDPLHFYILTGNFKFISLKHESITDNQKSTLIRMVKQYGKNCSVHFVDCEPYYVKYLKGNKNEQTKYSPYSFLRLLCDKIENLPDKILYLDCDTMLHKPINEIYNLNIENYDFAVNHDWLSRYWNMFRPQYLNSGIMLLNVDHIKTSKLFQNCRKYLFKRKLHLPDQTAIYKCADNFIFFPGKYRYNNQSGKMHEDTVVMHFCARLKGWPITHNIKSWDVDKVHSVLKIHEFDDIYEIYLKEKREWENETNSKHTLQR